VALATITTTAAQAAIAAATRIETRLTFLRV
jgi:hypothetical protein